jgi:hypothetical protein
MSVILVKDQVEQSRFAVKPYSLRGDGDRHEEPVQYGGAGGSVSSPFALHGMQNSWCWAGTGQSGQQGQQQGGMPSSLFQRSASALIQRVSRNWREGSVGECGGWVGLGWVG